MYKYIVLIAMFFVFACSNTKQTPVAPSPPVVKELPPLPAPEVKGLYTGLPRTDIQTGWEERKGQGWSVLVLSGMEEEKDNEYPNLIFSLKNKDKTVFMLYIDTAGKDLKTYAEEFAEMMAAEGAEVLRKNLVDINNKEFAIIAFRIDDNIILDFVTVKGTTVYNLFCGMDVFNTEQGSKLCIEYARSLNN